MTRGHEGREAGLPEGPALDALLRVSAVIAGGDADTVRSELRNARERCPRLRIEEALLQAYLFLGFPAAIDAFSMWRELEPDPPAEPPGADPDLDTRRMEGETRCRRIYGRSYDRLRARMRALHPALDRWMIEEGYGKGLARPALTQRERELCAVSLLAAAGFGPQLDAHARGALNVGASVGEVGRAVDIGLDRSRAPGGKHPDAEAIRAVWKAIEERCSSISSESG